MKKIYAVGVGGSGAKCIESLVFLQALGILGATHLVILLVDADRDNGNSQRTSANLKATLECQQSFPQGQTEWMKYSLTDYELWNPLGDLVHQSNLEAIFNKQMLTKTPLAKLLDALYSPAEQAADLGVGFRGRPPIGSAVMSRLELATDPQTAGRKWQKWFNTLLSEVSSGEEVTIHLFGSIFGGTGASGVPTLANVIANHLQDQRCRQGVHLNASILLPYFGFEKPEDGEQKVYAETRFFALNTQAALQYLTDQGEGIFDSVYLIGHQEKQFYSSATGGTQQRNLAHFVELYAALAVNHGWQQPIGETRAFYMSCGQLEHLSWQDLPDTELVKPRLAKGVRFAYAWRYNFSLELRTACNLGAKKFARGAPWFSHFFALQEDGGPTPAVAAPDQIQKAQLLDQWAHRFLSWSQQLASSNPRSQQFFNLQDLTDLDSDSPKYREELHSLLLDVEQSHSQRRNDRLDTIKAQLGDRGHAYGKGVQGLAQALFDLL